MTSPRHYYVSLTVRCDGDSLHTCLDRLSGVVPTLAEDMPTLDGASLSYSLDEQGQAFDSTVVALPVEPATGPVRSTGPGTPPPDAVDMPIPEPEPGAETSWLGDPPGGTEDAPDAPTGALSGQHADPEPLP